MKLLSFFKRQNKISINHNQNLAVKGRMYDSASSDLMRDIFSGGNIDEIVESQSASILRKAREAYANNDYVKGYISQSCTNIIGHQGIRIQ